MSNRDKIFRSKLENIEPFQFNDSVANVFDDMVDRSIPNYQEIHRILIDLISRYYPDKGVIYDLGCSTGTTIALLEEAFKNQNRTIEFVGIDTSAPMIEKAREKCQQVRKVHFIHDDISEVEFNNAQVFILNYTLQFLKIEGRLQLLKKIYDSLPTGGILILSEKINSKSSHMQKSITDLYYDFKRRNGYSELEIAQKREALENVLNPLTPEEQIDMLSKAGFNESEMLFRWYNFASYLAVKSPSKDV